MGVRKRRFKLNNRISYVGVGLFGSTWKTSRSPASRFFEICNRRHRMARECIVALHVVCIPILLFKIGGQPS
jgi:hypothetical protein